MAIGDTNLQVKVTAFPPGTCFTSNQDLANAVAASLQVIFPGTLTPWNIGTDEPSVELRDRPWLQLDAVSNTIIGIFTWSPLYGFWLSNHWLYNGQAPPTLERRMFVGTLNQLETYDGGEAGTVSAVTGPFWVQDPAFNGTMPYGVNNPSAININAPLIKAPFTPNTPAATDPEAIGVYFIMPSGRIFDRSQ